MVVDTSIILAVFFKEKHAEWALSQLNQHAISLRMSMINVTETLIHLQDRQPQLFADLQDQFLTQGIRFISPDMAQAQIAADARIKYPLNLGDCFAYALAKQEGCPILTLDKDFRCLDHEVVCPY